MMSDAELRKDMAIANGIGMKEQTQDTLNCSMGAMTDEGASLVFCNLPPRQSVSEFEPSRMSYYNGNEHSLSVPFQWEALPGKPIVDPSSRTGHQEPRLQLRPPPSASNSPLNPFVGLSSKDHQKSGLGPKFRSYSKPEFSYSMSSRSSRSSRSSSSTATVDSSFGQNRSRSKSSNSRRSDFDWPEVSDDEYSSPATGGQEPPAASIATTTTITTTEKQWFSSSSSTSSQTPSPGSSDVGPTAGGSVSTRDLIALRNLVNFAAASAAIPADCDVDNGAGRSLERSSTDASEGRESDSDEDDHVRPRGFFSCMVPIFSKVRMVQSPFGTNVARRPATINFTRALTPGSRNRGYRPNQRQSL